ncbi:hypothetical protein L9F63_021513, partial [Diploptera punctata]
TMLDDIGLYFGIEYIYCEVILIAIFIYLLLEAARWIFPVNRIPCYYCLLKAEKSKTVHRGRKRHSEVRVSPTSNGEVTRKTRSGAVYYHIHNASSTRPIQGSSNDDSDIQVT